MRDFAGYKQSCKEVGAATARAFYLCVTSAAHIDFASQLELLALAHHEDIMRVRAAMEGGPPVRPTHAEDTSELTSHVSSRAASLLQGLKRAGVVVGAGQGGWRLATWEEIDKAEARGNPKTAIGG